MFPLTPWTHLCHSDFSSSKVSENLPLKLHSTLLETNHLMQRRPSEGNGNVIAIAAAAACAIEEEASSAAGVKRPNTNNGTIKLNSERRHAYHRRSRRPAAMNTTCSHRLQTTLASGGHTPVTPREKISVWGAFAHGRGHEARRGPKAWTHPALGCLPAECRHSTFLASVLNCDCLIYALGQSARLVCMQWELRMQRISSMRYISRLTL